MEEKRTFGPGAVRCFWITEMGQRVDQWLPAGEYVLGETANIDGVDAVPVKPSRMGELTYWIHPSKRDYGNE